MTDPVALTGAITGVAGVLLSVFQEIRHRIAARRCLRLSARVDGGSVLLRVVNVGGRTVKAGTLVAESADGQNVEQVWLTSAGTLEEGDAHVWDLAFSWFAADSTVRGIHLPDTLGKKWRLPATQFRNVKAEVMTQLALPVGPDKAKEIERTRPPAESE